MERIGLVLTIAVILIFTRHFLRRSMILAWIVGILLLVSLVYTTFQGAGVLSKNPIFIFYGLLTTVVVNAFGILLLLADTKNKLSSIVKDSPLSNHLVRGAALCALLLLQTHLYAFLLYKFSSSHPGKGDLVMPLLLSFISGVILIHFYRDFRIARNQEVNIPQGDKIAT
ncbi:MAG: hypothetical protein RLZZ455_88 [Candidatus Parcubacteria bacterium]